MAVSQMEKLSIIGPIELKETVLQVMQGMQNIELLHTENKLSERASEEDIPKTNYQSLLRRVQEGTAFLQRYSKDSEQTVLKRKEMTLDELEASYEEEEFLKTLSEIETLKEQYADLKKTRKELQFKEQEFSRWQYLDVVPKNSMLQDTEMIIGVLNNSNQELFESSVREIPGFYFEEVYSSPHHLYYFLLFLKDDLKKVNPILNKVGFKITPYPYKVTPKEKYAEIKRDQKELQEKEVALKKQLSQYAGELEQLALGEEMILALIRRQKAETLMATSENLFDIDGWIPTAEKESFLTALYEKVEKDSLVIEFTEPVKGEDIPVKLSNNPIVAPFEMLTEMYSLPKYGEVDPTPLMTPFYMVFFGMMVADFGYGLIMLVATLIAKRFFVFKRSMTRFVNFFFILSFPTMIWGLIYGSFFGASLPKPFPLLSTTEDVNTILLMSVVFGFIQIMFGLIVNSVLLVRQKEYLNAVKDGFAWQGILMGIVIALVGKMLLSSNTLFYIGVVVAILCGLSIIFIPVFQSASKLKGLAKGVYGLYGITSYIGDLVSYTRLMALGISGGSIAAAFNMLVGYMPPIARFSFGIILIVALQALNLFLSLLSAYVHGARLQYVEFFGKFFTGGGRAFTPLDTEEKYVNIKEKKNVRK